ncbi:MAG TPA: hypothetical protein VJH91_00520 [Candidatus Paceibacterota bacterium]
MPNVDAVISAIANKAEPEQIGRLLYELAVTGGALPELHTLADTFGTTLSMAGLEAVYNSCSATYTSQKSKRPYGWNMWIPVQNHIIKGMVGAGIPQNAADALAVLKHLYLDVDDVYFGKVEAQLIKIALRDLADIEDVIDFAAELNTDRALAIFCMAFGSDPILLSERSLRRRKEAERQADKERKRSALL